MPEMRVIKPHEFKYMVGTMLEEYDDEVAKACYVASDEVCDWVVDQLKTAGKFKGNKYRRGWKKVIKQYSYGLVEAKVWNEKHYRLTHLLEFGHALVKGGRQIGDVEAKEHIKPINDKVPDLFSEKFAFFLGKSKL